ncbi:MAG: monovalent cation/H+ antiporter subunit D family protein [Eubacteriales bacterium]|nr:monovalent cation/H+ antiporter subunit D family protein [Desulforudis sp.]MDZ4042008.1 monovalent cation/H+ antiporter subunit D family protein [Eubacteriales bacterium]
MIAHFPILVIVVLLVAAAIVPLVGRINRTASWLTACAGCLASFLMAVSILSTVLDSGRISYWLGNWAPPFGIEYAYDPLNAFVLVLVSFVAFMVAVYARDSLEKELDPHRITPFYAVYMLFVAGLMGMVATADLFNLYVFLEITSIAGYVLIAVGRKRESLMASFTYLVMGTIAATFVLLGIGYLYMVTGTLNMADLARLLPDLYHSKVVLTAFAFFTVGLTIKIALFPLHNWLPNAYAFAPSVTSTIMAATATKVGAYALIRVMFTVFQPEFEITVVHVTQVLLFLATIAILAGSILAVAQTDIKKMLAYSSIGQIGYIVLGVALMNHLGMIGSIMHILNHALMKGGLFLVVGAIVYRHGFTHIQDFVGLGRKMPFTMAAFTIGALSMIGVPLTVGFVSKWYLALASLDAGMWYFVPVLLISSLITAVYFWRVIDNIYFKKTEKEEPATGIQEAPIGMLVPTFVLALLCIVFGIFASFPISVAEQAATLLLMR